VGIRLEQKVREDIQELDEQGLRKKILQNKGITLNIDQKQG
jgi:hypothetical protein